MKQQKQQSLSFWPLIQQFQQGKLIDLTHPFDTLIPHFENAIPLEVEEVTTYAQTGMWVQRFHFEGQWGTHVDAPAHFCSGKRTVDQIPLEEMLLQGFLIRNT